ncbi:MAG TPA: glycerophosphodiester phosphodiesterase family protein [Blastocatellia bacterium]|nr:glycerophosphodiester phosphodiesterase family protein [Blastocatellia bacterium]
MNDVNNVRPLVIAHRGASALAPENTLAAFKLALAIGADGVELDVQLSADGTPIVIHDLRVDRTTGGTGPVAALTSREIAALDAGSWFDRKLALRPRVRAAAVIAQRLSGNGKVGFAGEPIPSLETTLRTLAGAQVRRVYLEMKGSPQTRLPLLRSTLEIVNGSGIEQAITLMSFDHDLLRHAKERCPRLRTAPIFPVRGGAGLTLREIKQGRGITPDEVALHFSLATSRTVAELHERGINVAVWTANRKILMRRLTSCGVDSIITNFPDRLITVLETNHKRARITE